ncbi:RNA-directed DNA polymerase [uncultured Chryseobacterium sp.]|uniref:RNA-directed DNA polymerase n=1 Tax=uncultured Chryseobacterium sp. TaxID=259322 RepID=UPI0025DF482F|nr:RNA-directed DNA polymerase [uncultured Chryseobacterium sp.]
MNLTRIIEKGYFPKELPPPFNTDKFGKQSPYILRKWNKFETNLKKPVGTETTRQAKSRYKPILAKYNISKLFEYNIAKGQYSRRKIEVPHPQTYFFLCQEIVKNWKLVNSIFSLSKFSESKLYSEAKTKRSVRTKSRSWSKFRNKLTEISFDYKVQLKIDITNYYPTIYTHSIPWSILGKDVSKQYFKIKSENASVFTTLVSSDINAKKYQIADNIDTLVRNCNDKQSIGLPIGPDSSFILSEMLGSRLDKEIAENINDIDYKCIRYYDDYYFYTNNIGDAEAILKIAQQIFYEYKLEINENKINIKQLPYFQSDLWNIDIHNYQFKDAIVKDIQDLSYYFSLIFKLVDENKETSSWIISYSLTIFEYGKVKISKQIINTFISLLLKTLYLDTSNIDQIFKIILSYKSFLDTKELKKIKTLLDKLIPEHLSLNHSFEVAWGLWFFKSFDIQPNNNLLQLILNSEDQIAILITMDIINNKPLNKRNFDFTILESKLTSDNLFSKFWLISYELEIKGWSTGILDNIKVHEFFNILKYFNVDFYNLNSQVKKNFTARNHFTTNPFDEFDFILTNRKDTIKENEEEEEEEENDNGY